VVSNFLEKNNIFYERQKTFDDCINPITSSHLYFDFFIENKLLVEIDGEQHYDKSNPWYREGYDQIKDNWAKQHNLSLIRIKTNELNNIDLILEGGLKDVTTNVDCDHR
jgi:very-short-patch-repair endonuclease